jgi:predicted small lipoprotein YifL
MKSHSLALLITLAAVLTGCGEMGPPPQVKVDDFDIKMEMPSVEIPSPQPAPGVEPFIGLGTMTSPTTGVNLHIPDGKIGIANPSFKDGEDEDGSWDPTFDDFVIHVLTPAVPNSAFKVRWLVNEKVVEEDTMQPNSQSWMVGMRWDDAYPGDHILRVIIDPDNTVAETDEKDNVYETTFSIPD